MDKANLLHTIEEGLKKYKAVAFQEGPLGSKKLKEGKIEFREHIWTQPYPEKSASYVEAYEFYLDSCTPGMVSLTIYPKVAPKVMTKENLISAVNIVALGMPFTARLFADIIEHFEKNG